MTQIFWKDGWCGIVRLAAIFLAVELARTGAVAAGEVNGAPGRPPFALPSIEPIRFPDRTFDIRDFGAAAGGETLNTKAIAEAIAACSAAGGGRVLVPEGVWLTGPVHFKNNVNLHLHDRAELRFSQRFEDYLPVVYMQRGGVRCHGYSPLVYARGCTNIAVTGGGVLNGQGEVWWPWKSRQPGMKRLFESPAKGIPVEDRVFGAEAEGVRPPFIQTIECSNVLLDGFTVVRGPSWNIHPVCCENVVVRKVRVISHGPNNDGIDPDCCRNVIIEDCFLDTGDDCICLKAGRDEDAWAVGRPLENVVIRRCRTKRGHGGVVLGSEMSAGIRNVLVEDCQFEDTDRGIRIKSQPGRGGVIENVWFRNITMARIRNEAILVTLRYGSPDSATRAMPAFRNIHICHVRCDAAKRAVDILGLADGLIEDVTLERIEIAAEAGARAEFVRGLKITQGLPLARSGPIVDLVNACDVRITGGAFEGDARPLLRVEGEQSRQIILSGIEIGDPKRSIQLGEGVPPDAVRILTGETAAPAGG